jgi:hypothetical protein
LRETWLSFSSFCFVKTFSRPNNINPKLSSSWRCLPTRRFSLPLHSIAISSP